MRIKRILVCLFFLVGIMMVIEACQQGGAPEKAGQRKGTHTHYVPPPADEVMDNSRCLVCHGNFEDEALSVTHAADGVSCETCHGASDDHCGDENNITPPEIMYAKEKINPACMVCHSRRSLLEVTTHKAVLDPKSTKKHYCTECHGQHRMHQRTIRWDKNTGTLLD